MENLMRPLTADERELLRLEGLPPDDGWGTEPG
jgi:hypothetical protein